MTRNWFKVFAMSAAAIAFAAGASPAKAAYTISWGGPGTTLSTNNTSSDFDVATLTFGGISVSKMTDITDTGTVSAGTLAYAHSHSGTMTFTLDLRIDGVWTTIHSQSLTGSGTQQIISDIATPIDFTDGIVDGLRFTSAPQQGQSFHQFGSDLTFNFEAAPLNTVPAPAGAVLFGLGLTGLGGFRLFRRKSRAVAA